ncbi:MAG: hypothetical protein L0Y39_03260, partial [Methylococcaceae bacterium]|nr:hypothetical protein [Methylococcaceae bacterium]
METVSSNEAWAAWLAEAVVRRSPRYGRAGTVTETRASIFRLIDVAPTDRGQIQTEMDPVDPIWPLCSILDLVKQFDQAHYLLQQDSSNAEREPNADHESPMNRCREEFFPE